jgi:hypothetical protein
MHIPSPTLIKTRGGVGFAVGLCFLTLGAGGAWGVVAATSRSSMRPPPVPTLGRVPPASTKQAYAVFSFVDRKRRIYFQCKLDGAPFRDCSSPVRYGPAPITTRVKCKHKAKPANKPCWRSTTSRQPALAPGPHVFKVRAILGGKVGGPGSYSWTILGSGTELAPSPASSAPVDGGQAQVAKQMSFAISGNPEGLLYPGAAPRRIPLALRNPNQVSISVTALTVSAASENPECPVVGNLLITQSNASPLIPVVVPAGATVTLPSQGVTAPSIQLINSESVDQDGCKGSTFVLRYSGSAHS